MASYATFNTFIYSAMIGFRSVVNNDPGVDNETQEGLEIISGFSQKWYQSNHTEKEATWEREDDLREEFPDLFSDL